jgi:hypothetical protein
MPDNAVYYHAAYAAAAVLYGGYVVTLVWRARRYRQRESGIGNRESVAS